MKIKRYHYLIWFVLMIILIMNKSLHTFLAIYWGLCSLGILIYICEKSNISDQRIETDGA